MTKQMTSIGMKMLAAVAVVVALVVGVWVTGGVITNDFTLSMWLTAAWIAAAGLICLAIAVRRRGYAVAVLGTYLVVAGVIGIYLGRSLFFDDTVNERVATAASPAAASDSGSEPAPSEPRNELLGRGTFEPVAHSVSGTATTIRLAEGGNVLTLTDFEVDNGPDLRVYLVVGPARNESEVDEFEDLGALKGNKGNQQYEIPRELNLNRYTTVVIWCRAFSVSFARAPLR
jgi:Electron transfer DM13